jgi:hypothetical protein
MNGIDTSSFCQGQQVTTSLGPDRRRRFEVVQAGQDSVTVRDPNSGRRYRFPLELVAIVDLDRESLDHIDNYANDRITNMPNTTARLADNVSEPTPKQSRGRPSTANNLVRKRMQMLKMANPYPNKPEPEPEEDFRPIRRDTLERFMESWRE